MLRCFTFLVLAATLPAQGAPVPLNVLQYGNSYTQGNGGLPRMIELIAAELGPRPVNVVDRLRGGTTLNYHRFDPIHAGAITAGLPAGEQWDFVVMQGHSLETTGALGNRATFLANALGIHTNVRAHSPNARAVFFQTWARGQGHSFYPGTFANPAAMHHEIRSAYTQAVANSVAAFGPDTARRAAVGNGVALTGWDPALYTNDRSHPRASLSLLEAMTIHVALQDQSLCGAEPDFANGSPLVTHLANLGLGATEWRAMARLADRIAAPHLRVQPGSGDDLLLDTTVNGVPTVCGMGELRAGDTLAVTLTSPGGAFATAYTVVGIDLRPAGAPVLAFPGIPAIRLAPSLAFLLIDGLPGASGLTHQVVVPASLPGQRALVQGITVGSSAVTGVPLTATDGHELLFR